jgi:hypothetical protein
MAEYCQGPEDQYLVGDVEVVEKVVLFITFCFAT